MKKKKYFCTSSTSKSHEINRQREREREKKARKDGKFIFLRMKTKKKNKILQTQKSHKRICRVKIKNSSFSWLKTCSIETARNAKKKVLLKKSHKTSGILPTKKKKVIKEHKRIQVEYFNKSSLRNLIKTIFSLHHHDC